MSPHLEPIVCDYDGDGRVMVYYVEAACPTLIDTGGAMHPEGVINAALQARGTALSAIQAVINTHGHWDHAGGDGIVTMLSGAGLLIHELGAPLLLDHRQHLDGYYTESSRALEQPEIVAAQRAAFPNVVGPEIVPNRLVREGDRIDLGKGVVFQVLHVPGHSDDSIALWWEQEGVLIIGDAAQGTGSRPGSCPLYFGSIAQARASIARLREIPFATLHVSHFFGRLNGAERATRFDAEEGRLFLNETLDVLDLLEEALHRTLHDNPEELSFPAIARAVTARLVAGNRWPLILDPITGVPANAAPTLYRLWREIGAV